MSSYAPNAGDFCTLPLRRVVVRSVALLVMVSGLAACSAMPNWAKPAAAYGDAAGTPAPAGTTGFPDLANTPDKKPAVTSAADQKSIVESLSKDRAQSRDEDKALRKGAAPSGAATTPAKLQADEAAAMKAKPDSGVAAPAKLAETAAPVKAPAPAPAPAPVKQAEAPVAAPAPAPAPVPVPVKEAATPEAPASAASMAVPTPTPAAANTPAETPAETASTSEPGVIPMPPRGGHKTYAEVRSAQAKAMDDMQSGPVDPEAAKKAESAIEDDQGANAAPTQPVEVSPMPDNL